jgi:F0F1-type ATP synthase epsilon subunit
MAEQRLHLTIRTPHEVVFEACATSLRVPTESGQVGLRPRSEATLLAVETGLVLVATEAGTHFVGTAGGLLSCDGLTATLLTPLAVAGDDEPTILEALEHTLQVPREEMRARETLVRLEGEILDEIRRGQKPRIGRPGED